MTRAADRRTAHLLVRIERLELAVEERAAHPVDREAAIEENGGALAATHGVRVIGRELQQVELALLGRAPVGLRLEGAEAFERRAEASIALEPVARLPSAPGGVQETAPQDHR